MNLLATERDRQLARRIDRGEIAALILLSADVRRPAGVNYASLAAAAAAQIPVLGTGGTALGLATEMGALLLQTSGSVATVASMRAMTAVGALARYWRVVYQPMLPPPQPSVLPILDAALPAVIAILTVRSALEASIGIDALGEPAEWVVANAVPCVISAIAGSRTAGLGESGALGGLLAGLLCCGSARGNAVAGFVSGVAAGLASRTLLRQSIARCLPATAATLYTGAAASVFGGALS